MTAFQSMQEKLSATGLYNISPDTLVYAELMAYAEGLELISGELEELIRECFITTAESYGLTMRESMLKRLNLDLSINGRRNALINALSVSQSDYTYTGMEKIRDSFNAHGNFHATVSPLKVSFECTDTLNVNQQRILPEQMAKFMPCWLPFEFNMQ